MAKAEEFTPELDVSNLPGIAEPEEEFNPFPEVDPGVNAVGHRVLVQYRKSKDRTAGGIIIPEKSQEAEALQTTVVKVVSMGAGCYKNYKTNGADWGGGPWCEVGDLVQVPKYAGQRFKVGDVWFSMLNDDNILGKVTDVNAIMPYTPNLSFVGD